MAMSQEANRKAAQSELYQFLTQQPEKFDTPDSLFFSCFYDSYEAVKAALKHVKKTDDWQYIQIFMNWQFFKSHIQILCTKFEGSFACADKSSSILYRYIGTRLSQPINWPSDVYYMPRFGTQEQWFAFVESLLYLHVGNPTKYITALNDLMRAGDLAKTQNGAV
jgi:hypothetical protein